MNHKWEVELNPAPPHRVVRDGEDITGQIASITVTAGVGQVTTVQVEYIADQVTGTIEEVSDE